MSLQGFSGGSTPFGVSYFVLGMYQIVVLGELLRRSTYFPHLEISALIVGALLDVLLLRADHPGLAAVNVVSAAAWCVYLAKSASVAVTFSRRSPSS
jgi:hypothetical protein